MRNMSKIVVANTLIAFACTPYLYLYLKRYRSISNWANISVVSVSEAGVSVSAHFDRFCTFHVSLMYLWPTFSGYYFCVCFLIGVSGLSGKWALKRVKE